MEAVIRITECLKDIRSGTSVLEHINGSKHVQRIILSNAGCVVGCPDALRKDIIVSLKAHRKTLSSLELVSFPLTGLFSNVCSMLRRLPELRSLTLIDNGMDSRFLAMIPEGFEMGFLTDLRIEGQFFRGKSSELIGRLVAKQKSLVNLNISNCCLSPNTTLCLLQAIKGFPALQSLTLSDADLNDIMDSAMPAIASLVQLRCLNLSSCRLNAEMVSTLLMNLKLLANLESLDISGNNINQMCYEKIFQLIDNTTLTTVDISDNPLVLGSFALETRDMLKVKASSIMDNARVNFVSHTNRLKSNAPAMAWMSVFDIIQDPNIQTFEDIRNHTAAMIQFLHKCRHSDLSGYIRLFLRYCCVFDDRPADKCTSVDLAQRNHHLWREFVYICELIFFALTRHLYTVRLSNQLFSETLYHELLNANGAHGTAVLAVARCVLKMLATRKWFPKLSPHVKEILCDVNYICSKQLQGF